MPVTVGDGGRPSRFEARGVQLVMKKLVPTAPSGNSPWLTFANCGPNVTACCGDKPSGPNKPSASPPLLRRKFACSPVLVGEFCAPSSSAHTNRNPRPGITVLVGTVHLVGDDRLSVR